DDGKTGWLIPPDDQDSLTDALVAAATDHRKRLACGRRAQAESRHHGWPATIRRLALLYDELAAPAPGRHTAREQHSCRPRASPLNPHTETSLPPLQRGRQPLSFGVAATRFRLGRATCRRNHPARRRQPSGDASRVRA